MKRRSNQPGNKPGGSQEVNSPKRGERKSYVKVGSKKSHHPRKGFKSKVFRTVHPLERSRDMKARRVEKKLKRA